jgi:hypothetical protein
MCLLCSFVIVYEPISFCGFIHESKVRRTAIDYKIKSDHFFNNMKRKKSGRSCRDRPSSSRTMKRKKSGKSCRNRPSSSRTYCSRGRGEYSGIIENKEKFLRKDFLLVRKSTVWFHLNIPSMMKALESCVSSHPSMPRNPPPSTWESVCSWNEEDEIRFAQHEDKDNHSHSRRRFRAPTLQKQKVRFVPGPIYLIPALVVAW